MEEEKHNISILVEVVLYKRIKNFSADKNMAPKVKEEKKQKAIEVFIQECINNFTTMTESQIREHVMFVLNRTINNVERDE